MMKKSIGLVRVSTEAQAGEDRGSLAAQRVEIERSASAHGLELVEWVELRGVSGTVVLDDPKFQALRERTEDPEIHGVVVADLDRLMRPEDPGYYTIFRGFRDTNTVLYTYNGIEMYDGSWATGTGLFQLAALDVFPGTDDTTEYFLDDVTIVN